MCKPQSKTNLFLDFPMFREFSPLFNFIKVKLKEVKKKGTF